jgi:transcriptional regulator with XRE-family HTH domain
MCYFYGKFITMNENLGDTIRKIRELKNFSQSYMAERLGLSVSGYGKIERNETELTLSRIKQIAEIFEMDFTKVLSFDKNLVFNICNNHNGYGGLVHNHQNNNESNFQELISKIISDNQEFKHVLLELLKSKNGSI